MRSPIREGFLEASGRPRIGRGIHVEAGVPITLKESGRCK